MGKDKELTQEETRAIIKTIAAWNKGAEFDTKFLEQVDKNMTLHVHREDRTIRLEAIING